MQQTEKTTIHGYQLIPAEITERVSRNRWVVWFRCEIHKDGKYIEATPRRSTRSQCLIDGELRALRLRLLETAEITP